MDKLDYILARIEEGARVRFGMDYFGQRIAEIPRRWLPGQQRFKLSPREMDAVRSALIARRATTLNHGSLEQTPNATRPQRKRALPRAESAIAWPSTTAELQTR